MLSLVSPPRPPPPFFLVRTDGSTGGSRQVTAAQPRCGNLKWERFLTQIVARHPVGRRRLVLGVTPRKTSCSDTTELLTITAAQVELMRIGRPYYG